MEDHDGAPMLISVSVTPRPIPVPCPGPGPPMPEGPSAKACVPAGPPTNGEPEPSDEVAVEPGPSSPWPLTSCSLVSGQVDVLSKSDCLENILFELMPLEKVPAVEDLVAPGDRAGQFRRLMAELMPSGRRMST